MNLLRTLRDHSPTDFYCLIPILGTRLIRSTFQCFATVDPQLMLQQTTVTLLEPFPVVSIIMKWRNRFVNFAPYHIGLLSNLKIVSWLVSVLVKFSKNDRPAILVFSNNIVSPLNPVGPERGVLIILTHSVFLRPRRRSIKTCRFSPSFSKHLFPLLSPAIIPCQISGPALTLTKRSLTTITHPRLSLRTNYQTRDNSG